MRQERHQARRVQRLAPPESPADGAGTSFTLGPNAGLLQGRRVSTGTVRGLTILVTFQDVGSTVTRQDVEAMLNDEDYTANGNFCSVREYFRLVSDGKLDYSNDVVGPFTLSRDAPTTSPTSWWRRPSTWPWPPGWTCAATTRARRVWWMP